MQQEAKLGRMLHSHRLPGHRIDELFRFGIEETLMDGLEQADLPPRFGIENPALAGKDLGKLGIDELPFGGLAQTDPCAVGVEKVPGGGVKKAAANGRVQRQRLA
jgi:hypothetical protein